MYAKLEVIAGPMFSGKTELLISRLHRARHAKKPTRILKHARDTRAEDFIASRAMNEDGTTRIVEKLKATLIFDEAQLLAELAKDDYDVLAIDEAQFFPLDEPMRDSLGYLGRAIRALMQRRKRDPLEIIIAGLDMDAAENPFGPMPGLLTLANKTPKVTGVCMNCGDGDAHLSHRLISWDSGQIAVGDAKEYQVLCRACHPGPPPAP